MGVFLLLFRENQTRLLNGLKKTILLILRAKPISPKAIQMGLGVHRRQSASNAKMGRAKAPTIQKYMRWMTTGMSGVSRR
jgi:hypothetical protein